MIFKKIHFFSSLVAKILSNGAALRGGVARKAGDRRAKLSRVPLIQPATPTHARCAVP
jgi:hypothetical protein